MQCTRRAVTFIRTAMHAVLQSYNVRYIDDVFRLTEEVIEIKDAADQLRAKLADTERAMCNLAEVRASLERDLHVKNNSLQVDRELCMGLRKSHDMTPRICSDCCSR
jgi:Tektin family